jgi:DNA-directed RNA polymerase subunit beta'
MAYLNTVDAYTDLKAGVLKGIHANFPLEGKKQSIHLEGLTVRDEKFDPNDIEAQHQARMEGKTWASPVFGQLVLKDNQTGNVIDRQSVKLADIPHMTKRYSYIVDGKEIQVDNQWQLKPGVYTRRRANGELETQFNSPNRAFHMHFDPESKIFHMERGKSGKIPVYPLMKAMGVDDDTLEKSWGKEVLKVNQGQRAVSTALERFFKADRKRAPTDKKEALDYFHQSMRETTFDPESTEITLGHPHKSLTGDVFTAVTKKMLDVQNGSVPEDERDALVFKSLRTTADFAHDKLTAWNTRKQILPKVNRKINTARNIREVVKGALFNGAVKSTFTANALARTADQVNPLEMMEGAFQTTVMGPGGIQSERSVSEEAKLISESHFGFLDPIHTPEGNKTGVTLHLPLGVVKEGNKPTIPVFNMRTGQAERIDPVTFYKSKVALPDQVKWQGGKPVALSKEVQLSDRGNAVIAGGLHTADYVMRSPSQLFSTASNLIPWLGSNSGNRASYADTQMKQAISLKHREAPLVQTATGTKAAGLDTFEGFLGSQSAHVAPVGGTVTTVNKNHILVRGDDGKERKVSLYNNFPLNDPKAMLDSTAVVKVGQKVTRGQVVADNNFTRDGKLALGTNLRVGYLPYKGQNFEDGVVISRSAAEKMTSVHMHKPEIQIADTTITDARRFSIHHPEAFTRDQLAKVGENGIVQVGQKVKPGDPLVLATKPYDLKGRDSIAAVRKSLSTQQSNSSLTWKSDFPGEVVGVHKDKSGNVRVHVRTEEPMQIGDKLTGRAGNKGIVTNILEDHEMPRTQSGHLEVLLNPAGIPGRMNMGQVFETVASKIARKTGQPYVVQNFEHGVDQLARIKADLAKHGIPDQEEVHDPISGRSLGKALVGEQHLFKLNFQVDKKISARAGNVLEGNEPEFYDNNLIPAGGGKTGAQSLGNLALYSMLSHGATANIREMQTLKSEGPDVRYGGKKWDSQHQQVWNAIQTGERIPAPKKTFAFQKFEDMLRASGVDVVKKGHRLQLTPLTNSQVLAMSSGEVKDPTSLTYSKLDKSGEPAPIPGGLFDPKLTGGHGGRKWTHMKLAEPMPNPVFEGAIQKVLGMGTKNYSAIVNGERAVKDGKLVELDTPGSMAGGAAIAHMLSQIDTKTELEKAKKELAAVRIPDQLAHRDSTTKLDQAYKRVKYLQALDNAGITAKDAYTLHNLPIIPPAMRPASVLPDGSIKWDDINGMYKRLGENNVEMKHENFRTYLPDSRKAEFRAEMYDGLKALMGVGTSKSEDENESRGLFQQIAGANPKRGYFQGTLLKRRQDMTMRGTITPDAGMGLDNVGIPQDKALTLFRPFVTRKLVEMGSAPSPLDAHKMLSQKGVKDRSVYRALDLVMEERPVLLKRDPALHKHSIQAFKAHRVPGKSIMIHPLVTGGFGADFDGDTMAVYVPMSSEAVREAHGMLPSNNLYNEGSGKVEFRPTNEAALGLYKMSRVTGTSSQKFKDPTELLIAARDGKIEPTVVANVGGMRTTAGRVLMSSALPDALQKRVLEDHSFMFDKKGIDHLYTRLAKEHKDAFADSATSLMRMGYDAAFGVVKIQNPATKGTPFLVEKEAEDPKKHVQYISFGTHSFGLDDFSPEKGIRQKHVAEAQKKIRVIDGTSGLSHKEKDRRKVEAWYDATEGMLRETVDKSKSSPSNFMMMNHAGLKPTHDNVQQLRLAPMMIVNAQNQVRPNPILTSYSEGLSVGDYWTQQSGARRGSVLKVQEVTGPGAFTKQLMNTAMGLMIDADDCGTSRGISVHVGDKDIYDRHLASDVHIKGRTYVAGTVLTPDIVGAIRSADKNARLEVRSPLKCEHGSGLCQKCAGLAPNGSYFNKGTNLGVIATQSLGERSSQLTLKAFHSGGIAKRGPQMVNDFKRVTQLCELPKTIPNSARLSMKSGTIEKIENDPTGVNVWVGGVKHHVPKDQFGSPLWQASPGQQSKPWQPPKVGMKVVAGQPLSDPNRTDINPHDLYKATGSMEKVQNHLVSELHGIFGPEGVRRQHIETVVKAMSNLTRVTDPGDAPDIIKGEFTATSKLGAMNRDLKKRGLQPATHTPVLKGIKVLPLEVQEDWMAKLNHSYLKSSLAESAATGASSNLHGTHPIPGIAYGAEFGMNEKHQVFKPHLADVKSWHY